MSILSLQNNIQGGSVKNFLFGVLAGTILAAMLLAWFSPGAIPKVTGPIFPPPEPVDIVNDQR